MKTSHKRLRRLGILLSGIFLICMTAYAVSTTYGHWLLGGPHQVVRNMCVLAAIGAAGMILLARYYNREPPGSVSDLKAGR